MVSGPVRSLITKLYTTKHRREQYTVAKNTEYHLTQLQRKCIKVPIREMLDTNKLENSMSNKPTLSFFASTCSGIIKYFLTDDAFVVLYNAHAP